MNLAEQLSQGMAALGLSLEAEARRRLLDYAALIAEGNRIHSLTPSHAGDRAIGSHLLDCLAVLSHLPPGTIADVGSGAGLPGIPLALARPQHAVALIESHHGKAAFLRTAVNKLELTNVEVLNERVEALSGQRAFGTVISRALCDLEEFVRLAGRLCAPGGTLAAMKSVYPHEELARIPDTFRLRDVIALAVPETSAKHHLVLLDSVA